jgi:putative ABC transport system permease protein
VIGGVSRSMLGLAVDGLLRKWGRNVLTLSGVTIGVLALTLTIALGQGIQRMVRETVSGEENLRQIGVSPGFGHKISDTVEEEVAGEMSEARRERLRRALLARTRPGRFAGRRAQAIDDQALAALASVPHVVSAQPLVLERYRAAMDEHTTELTSTLGIDVGRRRYADRLIAGRYVSGPDAPEALLHEVLAYRWGYVSDASLASLVGKTLTLTAVENRPSGLLAGLDVEGLVAGLDLSALTEAERAALPGIVTKLARAFAGGSPAPGAPRPPLSRTFTIVGIVRELEAGDRFRVIEDGNAFQADVFLPDGAAKAFFLAAPVNRELGFSRAIVTVDAARNALAVEKALREQGWMAFSVASTVESVEDTLAMLTVAVSLLTGIALLVAALGIVNTMVTSVLERTREIGLWKAVGATRGQVRAVFLMEAALLGLVGGLAGLGLALLAMIPGEAIARGIVAERSAFPLVGGVFHVPLWLPIAGPALGTLVAMLASLVPAHRAARVDPVHALRHE